MSSLWPKIRKLLKALQVKGKIYMVNREQVYSAAKGRVYSKLVLNKITPIDEYNAAHPDDEKDPFKYDYVKEKLADSFSEADILLELVAAYKAVTDSA